MGRPPTVLLIENDAATARFIRDALELEGYRVLHAVDDAGLDLAQREQPAVILLDVDTPGPGSDAVELCRRLRADPRTAHIPIISMSWRYEHGAPLHSDHGHGDILFSADGLNDETIRRT